MKTVVITGGNAGLGFEAARVIGATRQWHVVIACRDAEKGAAAVASLRAEVGHDGVEALPLDLASLPSVRAFAATLREGARPELHALVCNAGAQFVEGRREACDGVEATFGVNHLGHFLLVRLLLDALAAPGRVVSVSSGTHDPALFTGMPAPRYTTAIDVAHARPDPGESAGAFGRRAYSTSKLCNVLFAYELARRLDRAGRAVTSNAFDPGLMPGTGLAREYGAVQRLAWRFLLPVLRLAPGVNGTATSGRALARLVLDPALATTTGRYFVGARARASSKQSYDASLALDLWEASSTLVGLDA